MTNQRNMSIDILKCIAIFSVIGVHFILNTANSIVVNSNIDIAIFLAYRQFFIICVPLFILTTGYLNIKKEPTKKYYKNILPIIGIYFFYSILSLIFRNTFMQESISIIDGVRLIFTFQAIPYAWYINMYLGLYVLIPFLNKIIKNSSKKEFELFILVILVVSILPATWNNFSTFLGYSNMIPLPNFWTGIYPIAYYIIGAYIKSYSFSMKKNYYYLLIAIFIYGAAIGTNYIYSDIGNISNAVKDYSSLFILIQSVCLFMLILNKKKSFKIFRPFRPLITKVANCTLEIYLVSYIIDNFIYKFFKSFIFTNTIEDYLFALPIVVSVFTISFLLVFFLKSIKKVIIDKFKSERNKYLTKQNKATTGII